VSVVHRFGDTLTCLLMDDLQQVVDADCDPWSLCDVSTSEQHAWHETDAIIRVVANDESLTLAAKDYFLRCGHTDHTYRMHVNTSRARTAAST